MPSFEEKAQPMNDIFKPNNVWGSTPAAGATEELTLPSGQTCLARRMTIESVIATGLMDEVDVLTATVDKHTRQVKGGNKVPDGPIIQNSLLKDQAALAAIIGLTDRLVPEIVVSPVIHLHYTITVVGKTKVTKMIAPEDREPGAVYTDQIALDDKMELFNWAMGGLEAFSSFRRESDGDVGTVGAVAGDKKSTKRRPRNR
jgi:hypothetical protein